MACCSKCSVEAYYGHSLLCHSCARERFEIKPDPIPSRLKVLDDYVKSMYLKDNFCDFLIITKDKLFPVHLVIVAAQCHYFKFLTRGSFKEATEKEVTIQDISASIMDDILKFCYTGECCITKSNFRDLFLATSKLQNDILLDICVKEASKIVSEDNFEDVFALGRACGQQGLCKVAANFASKNFKIVLCSPNFIKLDYQDLYSILKEVRSGTNPKLNNETEKLIYRSVVSWAEADEHLRIKHLRELFKFVELTFLGQEFLAHELGRVLNKSCQVTYEINIPEMEHSDEEAIGQSDVKAIEECDDEAK